MIRHMSAWLKFDPRSLALFRMLLGSTVAVDLFQRLGQWPAFYAADGMLPPPAWAALADGPWPPAWIVVEAGLFTPLFLGAGILLGVLFAAGVAPRLVAAVLWFVLAVVHARNPLLNYGADVLLRMLLLWSWLLPLDRCWTLRRSSTVRDPGLAGQLGFQVQVVTVFVIAGLAKAVDPLWQAGDGVARALDHELLATGIGAQLFAWPAVSRVLNHLTMALEAFGPLLLYSPWQRDLCRVLAVMAMGAMCVGFNLGLAVGLFPVAGFIGLVAWLPGEFWDRLGIGLSPVRSLPWGATAKTAAWLFSAAVVAFVLRWNVGLWYDAAFRMPEPLATLGSALQLEQRWGMFTRLPSTGRLSAPGRLEDGTAVELLAAGGPLPARASARAGLPADVRPAQLLHDVRWRVFFLAITEDPGEQQRRVDAWGWYLCSAWNRGASGGGRLASVGLHYARRPLRTRPEEERRYTDVVLAAIDCHAPGMKPWERTETPRAP